MPDARRCPGSTGNSSSGGTTTTISASSTRARRRSAIRPMPMTMAVISQNSGTNAATTAVSSPAAQAARRARRRGAVKTRPTSTATGGSSTSMTAVPTRPAATAPIPDRQQRVRERRDDARRHEPGHPAGGEIGRGPRERHAAEQDHVHRQPRLPAQDGRQRGDQRDIGRGVRGGPDAHRVEALEVLLPQAGHAAPGGDERAAAERGGAEQRPLRDQGDRGERQEQQHPGAGQQPLRQPGVDQQRVVVGGVVGGSVMAAHGVDGQRLGQGARGVLGELAERLAGR